MNIPKISVLVPVYKVEPYLQRCIDSVLNQDFTDWELILVDDGSPDRCPEICDRNATEHPDKIKVVHKENGGLITARKAGVQVARGEYYAFVDSDDTLRPGALHTLYSHIIKGYDMVRGGVVRKHSDGKEFPLETYAFEEGEITDNAAFIQKMYMCDVAPYLWGAIYKSSLFSDDVYDETIKQGVNVGEDWVTNMIIAKNIHRVLYVKDLVYDYYVNPVSYMSSYVMSHEYGNKVDAIFQKHCIYNDSRLTDYIRVKTCCNILRNFFVPELPFSIQRYNYVKKTLSAAKWEKMIRERISPKYLRFINHYTIYRVYTRLYRFLYRYVNLHGHIRKVI